MTVSAKALMRFWEANRPDLTVEAIVLQPKFRSLFSAAEIVAARERLGEYGKAIAEHLARRERLFPDELEPGLGSTLKGLGISASECIRTRQEGTRCLLEVSWAHLCRVRLQLWSSATANSKKLHPRPPPQPTAHTDGEYELDPVADLRPVCPNCHAMLHRGESVLSIEELRDAFKVAGDQPLSSGQPTASRGLPLMSNVRQIIYN